MPPERISVLVNPLSRTLDRARLDRALDLFKGSFPTDLIWTENPEHTRRLCAELGKLPRRLVVVCGGDGSILAAVNGLPPEGLLGILPSGTANVVAREFGIPLDLVEAAKVCICGAIRSFDTGVLGDTRFIMSAGIGFDAHVAGSVPKPLKRILGQFAYHIETMRKLPTYRPPRISVRMKDGRTLYGAFALFANLRRYGGGIFFAPGARPDDGLLDLVLFRDLSFRSFLKGIHGAFLRRGVPAEVAETIKGTDFSVFCDMPTPIQLDGEVFPPITNVGVGVRPGGVRIVVP